MLSKIISKVTLLSSMTLRTKMRWHTYWLKLLLRRFVLKGDIFNFVCIKRLNIHILIICNIIILYLQSLCTKNRQTFLHYTLQGWWRTNRHYIHTRFISRDLHDVNCKLLFERYSVQNGVRKKYKTPFIIKHSNAVWAQFFVPTMYRVDITMWNKFVFFSFFLRFLMCAIAAVTELLDWKCRQSCAFVLIRLIFSLGFTYICPAIFKMYFKIQATIRVTRTKHIYDINKIVFI